MSVFKRGEVWWYEFVHHGQRVRESSEKTSRTAALKVERDRRKEFEDGDAQPKKNTRNMTIQVASKDWLDANRARWSESTVAIHEYNLKHLLDYFGSMLLTDINPERIGRYQSMRKDEKASNRTVNLEVGTLRMIVKYKNKKRWLLIAENVKMLSDRKRIGKALSVEEQHRLIEACRRSPQPSLYTAVAIFCNTGLRNAELRRARWSQVDLLKGEFQVGEAKTEESEDRIVPLNRTALGAFTQWRSRWPEAKPTDYIFPTEKLVFKGKGTADQGVMTSYGVDLTKPLGAWKTAWATAKRQAGVTARIHDLRHHFITLLAEGQASDATIQAISGHRDPKMLRHYSHVRKAALRRAVEALDGISVQ
jgi:integrase